MEWCGYLLSEDGHTVNPTLVNALTSFPVPKWSFCGLVEQFEAFSADLAGMLLLIRLLMSPKVAFLWEVPQEKAFKEVKAMLTSPRVLTT